MLRRSFIRPVPPSNFPTFFMFFVFGRVYYCRSEVDLKKGQRQAKVWQLKRTLFQAEHVTFTD